MKKIEIDDELYQYIAGQTQHIGESASSILRRLLDINVVEHKSLSRDDNNFSTLVKLVSSSTFLEEKKLVNRFLLILSSLYLCDKRLFSKAALSLHGSKRRYLSQNEEQLLQSGNNTKPRPIPNSPYFVVTNSNTDRKIFIIEALMNNMAVPEQILNLVKRQFVTK